MGFYQMHVFPHSPRLWGRGIMHSCISVGRQNQESVETSSGNWLDAKPKCKQIEFTVLRWLQTSAYVWDIFRVNFQWVAMIDWTRIRLWPKQHDFGGGGAVGSHLWTESVSYSLINKTHMSQFHAICKQLQKKRTEVGIAVFSKSDA